ncbi:ABC transporter permease subunit [Gordonia alkanivorans]|uniref:ABC transporter permease protein n=1 Tax=Gordonia alkanivorans NBRC 16433 TaxID=1027371 RepID=F9W1Y7_9ACTN|nr:ABC transporter permease subunit [Gordonia alkanivorans]MDH3020504.1 ABC transporter permease subunit [Gordonia alkanivorans]MDH3049417.1 ABC transporter permease subunit [Gordonia alkanivorans]MDJ0007270.1 ABC transporter permease subunit [Gordonia alkanivorans]MDJ0027713.1 ABC transporter permease subunit [Gordonia alkanivorans]MDJ0098417.1 ABC transporter permease subunit [Gordonia alkanivorans]
MTVADFRAPLPTTGGIDVDRPGIPFGRLVGVELRKLVDTRAGFWLTASIGVIAAVIMVAMLIANRNDPENLNLGEFFGLMNIPTAIILPILAILLVTGEWSQRTALTTFTLEPRRKRIIGAKLVASLITGVAAVAVALVLGIIGNSIAAIAFADPAGAWGLGVAGFVNSFVIQAFGLLLGFGFAALILNTPGAVVAYFALPTALSVVSELVPWFKDNLGQWVDTTLTHMPFQSGEWATGGEWARLLVSGLIWIALPLGIGLVRVMRSEVK